MVEAGIFFVLVHSGRMGIGQREKDVCGGRVRVYL